MPGRSMLMGKSSEDAFTAAYVKEASRRMKALLRATPSLDKAIAKVYNEAFERRCGCDPCSSARLCFNCAMNEANGL